MAGGLARGKSLAEQFPWWGFVDDRICLTRAGRLLAVSRLTPMVADGASQEEVNRLVHHWNRVLMALGPDVRLWWVVDRWRERVEQQEGLSGIGAVAAERRRVYVAERVRRYSTYLVWEFDRRLASRVGETPEGGRGWLVRKLGNWLQRRRTPHVSVVIRSVLDDVLRDVRGDLSGFEARFSSGTEVSPVPVAEAVQVLHRLVNAGQGEWVDGLETSRGLNWRLAGREQSISRSGVKVGDQLVRVWSLVSAPRQVVGNCLEGLYGLNADFSVVLGWAGIDREAARAKVRDSRLHYFRARVSTMGSMGEGGEATALEDTGAMTEVAGLGQALSDLQDGSVGLGKVHLSIAVRAQGEYEFEEIGTRLDRVVGDIDAKVVRETYGTPPVWFGRLPGQTAIESPRELFLSSGLVSAMAPLVGPARGHDRCAHLGGSPVTWFETAWGTSYGFDLFGGADVGHTLILGATGSGKSFFLNFLLVQCLRYDPRILILDLGGSYEYLTRFVDGSYFGFGSEEAFDSGEELGMGLRPFSLPQSVETVQFLQSWILRLLELGGYTLEGGDGEDVTGRVKDTYRLEPGARTLWSLVQSLPPRMRPFLSSWVQGGSWARWFDGAPGTLEEFAAWQVVDLAKADRYRDWCEAALWFVLQRMRLVMDDEAERARLKVMVVDEAWKFLRDPMVAGQLVEAGKTWRKRNGVLVIATQSPGDVVGTEPQLLESLPTKVFLANPDFPEKAAEVLQLSDAEVETIRTLEPKREVYVRRSSGSAVVTLTVDAESYWLYTSDTNDAVRREAAVKRWGLAGGLMRLAAGVDQEPDGLVGRTEVLS